MINVRLRGWEDGMADECNGDVSLSSQSDAYYGDSVHMWCDLPSRQ